MMENGATGSKALLLGNEAVARGALEAGVQVVASYPGTPSTEIAESLAKVARKRHMHVEWSTNEKVAYEVAYGASLTGVRALMSTKHLGMNWIADPLIVSAYTGTNAGLVVAVADDTHPYSSQNAADSRYYAKLANIPCLEPSTPQEAKDLTIEAFALSEKLSLPVLLRLTNRVSHTRADVSLGTASEGRREPHFTRDRGRYVVIASAAQKRHAWLNAQMEKCKGLAESFPWNAMEGGGRELGIMTEGVTYGYAIEAARGSRLLDRVSILKLGMVNPLPPLFLSRFLQNCPKILILEENEPIVEREMKALAHSTQLPVEIYGRETGHIPRELELNPDVVAEALQTLLQVDPPHLVAEVLELAQGLSVKRTPYLCAGCPHRASYHVIGGVLK
jgi:indolepyruvate ferredoxin oxidoreductase alpha subunit